MLKVGENLYSNIKGIHLLLRGFASLLFAFSYSFLIILSFLYVSLYNIKLSIDAIRSLAYSEVLIFYLANAFYLWFLFNGLKTLAQFEKKYLIYKRISLIAFATLIIGISGFSLITSSNPNQIVFSFSLSFFSIPILLFDSIFYLALLILSRGQSSLLRFSSIFAFVAFYAMIVFSMILSPSLLFYEVFLSLILTLILLNSLILYSLRRFLHNYEDVIIKAILSI